MRAKKLSVDLSIHESGFEIQYCIDRDFRGTIAFVVPFSIDVDQVMSSTIGLWGSIFLAQLCLAEQVEVRFPLTEGMIEDLLPVVRSLYDVRCYRDRIPLVDLPSFEAESIASTRSLVKHCSDKRACVLWSGGTDSTLALILLAQNGFESVPVHFSANVGVEEFERSAVARLANQLGLSVHHVQLKFPDFLSIAQHYSSSIARPPHENSIPHGRELLLFGPTLVVARHLRASSICPAHENEVWTAQATYEGKTIWRWDTQSEAMTVTLDNFVSKYLDRPVRFFSPGAPLTDFGKFSLLLSKYPHLLRRMSSCYWDRWCGQCTKCVRYYLYQRALGGSVVAFQHNPVEQENAYLRDYVYSWENRELTYWADMQYALYTIVDKQEHSLEPLLEDYRESVYPAIADEIASIRQKVLRLHSVKLLPEGWNFVDA